MKLHKAESSVKKQYMITAVILLAVLIPMYIVSYNINEKNISSGIRGNIDVTMNMLDNEIENLRKIAINIIDTQEYAAVNRPITVDTPAEYARVKDFSEKYTQMIDLTNIIKDSFIVLKCSNIAVSKKLVICGEDYYDMNDFIRFGDMGFDEFLEKASKSALSETWHYFPDTVYCGEKADMLAVCLAASRKLNSDNDSVIIGLININDLFDAMGITDIKDDAEYMFTSYDGSILCKSGGFDKMKGKLISYNTDKAAIRVDLKIAMSYYHGKMRFLHLLMLFYTMLILGVGVGIVFFLRKMHNSKIHSLALAVEEFTGIENVKNDYEYIGEVVKGINSQNLYLDSVLTSSVIYKLFTMTLTEAEYELIKSKYPDMFGKSIILIIKSSNILPEIIDIGIKQYELDTITILRYYDGNIVVLIKAWDAPDCYEIVSQKMREFVLRMKESGIDMYVAVSSICDNIRDFPEKYKATYNLLRHLEHKNIIIESENSTGNVGVFSATEDKLYELILSGNAFKASCLVYEQWYCLTEGGFENDSIEQLFFDQRRVLLKAAKNMGYSGEIINYDSRKNIQEIAFSVTACIEKLCDYIKNLHSESKIYDDVIEYILENYCDISFCMAEVEERFDISDKTVSNIVKQKTGGNFSNFVENLRIDKAKELLETSTMKIADISAVCGYGTEGAFYKAFKKKLNVSPGVYRKSREQKSVLE